MKRSFVLFVILMVSLNLFAEGSSKGAKECSVYKGIHDEIVNKTFDNSDGHISFISDWFDHLEEADENSGYDGEFLQEHGGRVGKIVYRYKVEPDVDCEANDDDYDDEVSDDWIYDLGCSGTLIGEQYFLTAGHCAVKVKEQTEKGCKITENAGVLFGYQKADLEDNDNDEYDDEDDEINDDDSETLEYPRVSLRGYLDKKGIYRRYGEEVPDMDIYSNFMEHPAYFPIIGDNCNADGSVEKGFGEICWNKDGNKEHYLAATTMWIDETTHIARFLGKIDYAIYKLKNNNDLAYPEDVEDPWPWVSENNQLSQNTLSSDLLKPWQIPDNTNGARGWARVNTAVQQPGHPLNIIGHPWVASIFDGQDTLPGIKVVNAGSVVNGQAHGLSKNYEEDILVFKDADIQTLHSGSPVIDYSGRLAGVVVWFGCAPGEAWDQIEEDVTLQNKSAENYATPMWKICRASQIIKNAAMDQNCNGIIDWSDFHDTVVSFDVLYGIVNINGLLIDRFEIRNIPLDLKNYRYDMNQKEIITETRELPAYTYQVAIKDNGDLFYVALQNNAFYLFRNGTALGEISNYPQLNGSSTLVKGNDIYFAGGNLSVIIDQGIGNNNDTQYITKISSNGQNGYSFSGVAAIPAYLEDIRIFALGNDIYVTGNTTTNFVVYKLVADNQSESGYSLSVINASQPVRKDYNLTAAEGRIIVSGGATMNISSVLNLDEEDYPSDFAVFNNIIMLEPAVSNNWVTVAENINDKIIMLSVTAIDNGNLVLVNPFITVGNSMQKLVLDLSDIPISNENLRVSFEFHPVGFCLAESESSVSGGIETGGECVPFTHPWYSSFSAGATVYSLDGKGERLYVGTNNAIKIYDISDPISPVLVSSFSTSSRVNGLEVYGNTLFAATNSGLYKLNASDPDELTQILFISTVLNYQYKVEVYDGKLYVGDDNGIKVRDLETLSVLTSVNNGSVLDFAIENGEIGLYKDALFSPVEIRDADTLALKANEFFGCFEIEVGSSDGRFYLSCDDETYRFEDNGDGGISFTELSGDIRELQDVYTFDGYTYFYDENTIWISTSNDVPALCGNGIVEGDEVCDGTPINCEDLDSNYVSGTATCNSTCDGYNTNNCSDDGW